MNIILIGMPGSGKSTTGVVLAKALGYEFVDTDILIQKAEGRLLQQMIDEDGLTSFLEAEERSICAATFSRCVVATGGSAVYSSKGMAHLKQNGVVVYLDVPLLELARRIGNFMSRGIVIEKGKTLEDIYRERRFLYQKYADITLECGNKRCEQVVDLAMLRLSGVLRARG